MEHLLRSALAPVARYAYIDKRLPLPVCPIRFKFAVPAVAAISETGHAESKAAKIGAFHDLKDFEGLLVERHKNIFSIVRHDYAPPSVLFDHFFSRARLTQVKDVFAVSGPFTQGRECVGGHHGPNNHGLFGPAIHGARKRNGECFA